MGNNKGGSVAIRIALISVSLLALVLAFLFFRRSEYMQYDYQRKVSDSKAEEYLPEIDALMEERDYIGVYNYMTANNISFSYGSQYREYYDAYRTTEGFIMMYEYLLELRLNSCSYDDYMKFRVNNLTSQVQYIGKNTSAETMNSSITRDNVREYMEYLRKDAVLFLKAYLFLDDTEAERIYELTDSQLGVLIEEAVTDAWN